MFLWLKGGGSGIGDVLLVLVAGVLHFSDERGRGVY
jgi:hypothetical protein